MVPIPLMTIEGEDPSEPDEVVICTPATIPSRARVASELCTLAMSADFTTAALPVKASLVEVPKATTMVSSRVSVSGDITTLICVLPSSGT